MKVRGWNGVEKKWSGKCAELINSDFGTMAQGRNYGAISGPEVPQEASPLPVPPPPTRPVIYFTTNCSHHHAGCEASTFTNTHVPFIATARATPGT